MEEQHRTIRAPGVVVPNQPEVAERGTYESVSICCFELLHVAVVAAANEEFVCASQV
jgi:hypothetical protein